VVGAGLLVRSFSKLTAVDAGFSPDKIVTFGISMPQAVYAEPARRVAFVQELQRKIKAIPGVEAVGAASGLPPQRQVNANDTQFEGLPNGPTDIPQNRDYDQFVTADYFETMDIPVVKGRGFLASDALGAPVVIVNEALVKRFYPEADPIGKRIRTFTAPDTNWQTIVGVVRDVKQAGLDQPVGTEVYTPIEQAEKRGGGMPNVMNILVRTSQPIEAIGPSLRRAVREMDQGMPLIQMRSMTAVFGETVTRQRFLSTLLAIFGGVALTLAAVGTYGVVSYLVTERQREIGIRIAIGADSSRIVKLVLWQGLSLAVVGIVIGIGAAFGLSRLTSKLLFGVSPSDPLTYVGVAGVIAAIALIACMVPARRAMRVDPLTAIRGD
jgi:predicted permease